MADQVEIVGEALKLLQKMEASLRSGSAVAGNQTPRNTIAGTRTPINRNSKDPIKATAKSMGNLEDETDNVTSRFGKLDKSIKMVTMSFGKLIGQMGGGPRAKAGGRAVGIAAEPLEVGDANEKAGGLGAIFGKLSTASSFLTRNLFGLSPTVASLGTAFWGLIDLIRGPGMRVFNDAFRLQARGISAQNNLLDFYLAAGKAGMSLEEYTKLLEDNAVAVVRQGSFKDFNRALESSTGALAGLGVFGESARNLSATMMSSATTLGIPQEQLSSVMQTQIDTFGKLRKSTLMTAAGFQEVIKSLSENENVQSNLLGMAPQERAARMQELLQIRTLGDSMGLTKEQSAKLGDALLAQRKATAPERFKAMGAVRQAGAIMGMGATDTEELARLSGKKNLTAEEGVRFADLAGTYQKGLEQMMNSGQIGIENIAEQLEAQAPGAFANIAKAAGLGKLTKESGPVRNKDIGVATEEFGQAVGKFATAVNGLIKSPLYDALKSIGTIFGGLAAFALAKKGMGILLGKAGKAAPAAKVASKAMGTVGVAEAEAAGQGLGGRLASSIGDALSNTINFIKKPLEGLRGIATANIGSLEGIGYAIGNAVGSTIKTFKSIPGAVVSMGSKVASMGASMGSSLTSVAEQGINYVKTFAAIAKDGGLSKTELLIQEGGAALKGAGKMAAVGLEGLSGVVKGAGAFFKGVFGPELGFIFGAIEEMFTGEMASSLGLGDGIFGRLLGVVVAGFNSIFTGVSRLFDDVLNWLFEGLGINVKVNTTKFFDYITGGIVDGWKLISLLLMKGLASMLEGVMGMFGIKAPFVQRLRDSADELEANLEKSYAAREKMWADDSTLREVGEKNLKAEKKLADEASKQADRVVASTSKVVNGMDALATSALSTATSAQMQAAGVASNAAAQVATPGQTTRQQVTPPDVNKAQVEEKKVGAADKTAEALKTAGMQDVIAVLQQQLDIAKQLLAATLKNEPEQDTRLARTPLPSTAELTQQYYAA